MDGTKFYIIIINLKCKLSFSVHGGFTPVLIFNGHLRTRKKKKSIHVYYTYIPSSRFSRINTMYRHPCVYYKSAL